jgi:hypothetical protein
MLTRPSRKNDPVKAAIHAVNAAILTYKRELRGRPHDDSSPGEMAGLHQLKNEATVLHGLQALRRGHAHPIGHRMGCGDAPAAPVTLATLKRQGYRSLVVGGRLRDLVAAVTARADQPSPGPEGVVDGGRPAA